MKLYLVFHKGKIEEFDSVHEFIDRKEPFYLYMPKYPGTDSPWRIRKAGYWYIEKEENIPSELCTQLLIYGSI